MPLRLELRNGRDIALATFGPNGNLPEGIGFGVVLCPFLWWAKRRLLDSMVIAAPDALRVYNGLGTHVLPWSEIEGFRPSSKPFLMAVQRTHGRPVTMAGLTPGMFGNRAAQEADMARLERFWTAARR